MAYMTCRRSKDCWCRECHALRREQFSRDNLDLLREKFVRSEQREEQVLQNLFCEVLDRSAIAYTFKLKMKESSGYTYPKPYLKYIGYSEKTATELANDINEAAWVYENLHTIVNNITQFDNISICRLSLNQLYLARQMSWCYQYSENQKGRGKKPEDPVYDEQDFKDLEGLIRSSAAYISLDKDPRLITAMMKRFQRNLVKHL